MNVFFTLFIIGISLSMDAFSLALVYGTYGIDERNKLILSFMVGLFHFFMPLLGLFFGNFLNSYFSLNFNVLIGIIFGVIGVEMIISSSSKREVMVLSNFFSFIMFSLSVSIDSFTTGIGIRAISDNYLYMSFIFMICSFSFTYMGLFLGNKLNEKFGNYSTFLGGIMLIILAIYYYFK